MRDFTWHVFKQTGDIEAYLLYKEMDALGSAGLGAVEALEQEEEDGGGEKAPQ